MKRILFALLVTCSFPLFAVSSYDTETYKITLKDPSYCNSIVDENGTIWCYRTINSTPHIYHAKDVRTYDGVLKYYRYTTAVGGTIPANIVVPSRIGATVISPLAFADLTVKSISIPESVTSIGQAAFSNCPNLTEVILPQKASVGAYAFQYCTSLTTIPTNLSTIPDGIFAHCLGFISIEIPETVTSIGSYAFATCENLESIKIPETVTSIKSYAFNGCHNLKSITIPKSVISIGEAAFNSLNFDEFRVFTSPNGWHKEVFGTSPGFIKLFRCPSEYLGAWLSYFAAASITPLKIETELSTVKVLSTLNCGGTLSFRNKQLVKGETASITAMPNEGYIFLGWSSDVEEIGGSEPTLTFTVPERDEVLLIANFFPKAVLTTLVNETLSVTLDEKVDARIEAKIDGESLLTAEQAATKTSATIEAKVADGELITSEQLQVMAMEAPVIAVADGVAKVGVSLKRAASLDGEWQQVEMDAAEITEEGAISVSVPADEKAAFYKFVVPNKQ